MMSMRRQAPADETGLLRYQAQMRLVADPPGPERRQSIHAPLFSSLHLFQAFAIEAGQDLGIVLAALTLQLRQLLESCKNTVVLGPQGGQIRSRRASLQGLAQSRAELGRIAKALDHLSRTGPKGPFHRGHQTLSLAAQTLS